MATRQHAAMAGRPIAFVCAMPMELEPLTRDLGLVETDVDGQPCRPAAWGSATSSPSSPAWAPASRRRRWNGCSTRYDVDHVLVVGIAGAGVGDAADRQRW